MNSMALSMLRLRPLHRARSKRPKAQRTVSAEITEVGGPDIDLTRPDWDTVGDLSEDFDNKMECFMAFDDGRVASEREWLTG